MIWSTSQDQQIVTAYGEREHGRAEFVIAGAHHEWGDDANMVYGVVPEAQREANARLVSAAPDMLAALVALNEHILGTAESNASGNPNWEYVSERVNAARAAIAKATP